MPDWKTRLAVSYIDEDSNEEDITPIDSFTPTFSINAEILHSIEDTHMGMIFSPEQMTFSISVKAIGAIAGKLTALAISGKRFDITLQEATGDDWAFQSVVMSDCIITSASPTNASPSGAPTATFSGVSLAASSTLKGEGAEPVSLPA